MKKYLSVLLSIIMIISTVLVLPLNVAASDTNDGVIALGETKTVSFTEDDYQEFHYFEFTPSEDGFYAFYSLYDDWDGQGSQPDPYGLITSADGLTTLTENDDGNNYGGVYYNFYNSYGMTAGTTYRLYSKYKRDTDYIGSYNVKVEKITATSLGDIALNTETNVEIPATGWVYLKFTSAEYATYHLSVKNMSNATVCFQSEMDGTSNTNLYTADGTRKMTIHDGQYTYVIFRSYNLVDPGSCKITVNKENVVDKGAVELDKEVSFERKSVYDKFVYSFTPAVTDYYFYSCNCVYNLNINLHPEGESGSIFSIQNSGEFSDRIHTPLYAGTKYLIEFSSTHVNVDDTVSFSLTERKLKSGGTIAAGEVKTVSLEMYEEEYFEFTPAESGAYAFICSPALYANSSGSLDTYGAIYTVGDTTTAFAYNDDTDTDVDSFNNFFVAANLTAGTKYLLSSRFYNQVANTGSFEVTVKKIDDVAHTHVMASENIIPPTCTEYGHTVYTCECGYSGVKGFKSANGHNFQYTTVKPTCTEQGYTLQTCANCDYEDKYNYTDATGHSFTNYVSDNNATCTTDGTKTAKCDNCNATDTITVTETALGHDYTEVVTQPTCTGKGYTTHTCTRCGDSYADTETAALGHKSAAAKKENVKAATYTKAGSYDSVVYCSVCKKELSRKKVTIPMKVGTFKITYKLNGGKNGKNPATFKTNKAVTLKNPTKKGYKFAGWYTNAKFTGKKVTSIAKGTAKNITLYAKWSKVTYKITYKLNKGKNGKNPKTYTVTTKTFTLKNATRKGYTFKGWYLDSKFKKKVAKIAKGTTGNKTLYAKWVKKK